MGTLLILGVILVLVLLLVRYVNTKRNQRELLETVRERAKYKQSLVTTRDKDVAPLYSPYDGDKVKPRWRAEDTKKNITVEHPAVKYPDPVTDYMVIASLASDSVFDRSHTVDVPDSPTTGFENGFGGGAYSGGGSGGSWSDSSSSSSYDSSSSSSYDSGSSSSDSSSSSSDW